jgi:VWFA-related protein
MKRAAVTVLVASLGAGQQQVPIYRSTADAVTVDVSVLQRNRPVKGLGLRDFALWDNDERQSLMSVSVEEMALDVTLLVDVSRSLDDARIAARTGIEQAVERVSRHLRSDDRLQLLALDSRVREADSSVDLVPSARPDERQTALFDALIAAAVQPVAPGRRRLIVALTDGIDTLSTVSEGLRAAVMDRTASVVHIVAMARYRARGLVAPFGHGPDPFHEYSWALQDLVRRTGGRLFTVGPTDDFVPTLQAAVEEFRLRYLLRYTPSDRYPGWHRLRVSVTREGRYDIHHRPGYWLNPARNHP